MFNWGNDDEKNNDDLFGGMDLGPNMDKEELLKRTQEALEQGLEWMGKIGKEWQGSTPNDQLARDMVATGTMLLDGLRTAVDAAGENPKSVNPLLLALGIRIFEQHMQTLAMLHSLSALRMGFKDE